MVVVYPFLNFDEWMFISITSFIYYWTYYCMDEHIFFIHVIHYIGFKCGSSTYEGIYLVYGKNFLIFNIFTIL